MMKFKTGIIIGGIIGLIIGGCVMSCMDKIVNDPAYQAGYNDYPDRTLYDRITQDGGAQTAIEGLYVTGWRKAASDDSVIIIDLTRDENKTYDNQIRQRVDEGY